MEKSDKKKLNGLGIFFAVFSSLYAIYYGILAILTPFVFKGSIYFGFYSNFIKNQKYSAVVLLALQTFVEIFTVISLVIWIVSFVFKFKSYKFPNAISLIYCGLKIVLEIFKAIILENTNMSYFDYAYLGMGFLLFILLLIGNKKIYKLIFLCVSSIFLAVRTIIYFSNFIQLLPSYISNKSIGVQVLDLIAFILMIILYVFFILFIFKSDLFYKKSESSK